MEIIEKNGKVYVTFSVKEAKELSDDLGELERHFDLDTFCESDDHPIGRFNEALGRCVKTLRKTSGV